MHRPKILARSIGSFALGISGFTAALLATGLARAATVIHVDSNCTIVQAFETLNTLLPAGGCEVGTGTGDTVELGNTTYNLDTRLFIYHSATVKGHPSGGTKIVADNLNGTELFWVESNGLSTSTNVTMTDVTLDGSGTSTFVSGIFAPNIFDDFRSLALNLTRVRVMNFTWGGLYLNDASLSMSDSQILNNASPDDGGGIRLVQGDTVQAANAGLQAPRNTIAGNVSGGNGGGFYTDVEGTSNLTQTTVVGNFAANDGGGVYSMNEFYLHATDCTVAFNSAGHGGGGFATAGGNSIVFNTSIISNNSASGVADSWDGYTPGVIVAFHDTLIGHVGIIDGQFDYTGADLRNVDPLLDGIGFDLGGVGHQIVHRPLPGSPALDYTSTDNTPDQRGFPAPRDADGNGTKLRDIGAYEHDPNWQNEMLLVAAKSSDTHALASTTTGDTSTTYSNALGTNLQANTTNDFVTYFVPIRAIGNYNVKVRVRRGTNRGKFQLAWSNNVNGPWTNIGGAQDLYSSTTNFIEFNLNSGSPTNIGSQGQKYFRFLVSGKNIQSSGYQLFLDYIKLTKL